MLSRSAKPIALLMALLLAAGASAAWGQEWAVGRGRLQGTVRDESGKPVQGAKVTLRPGAERVDPKAEGPAPVTTDKHGKWSILGLVGGPWGVLIEKEGFMPSEGQVKVNEFGPAQPINVTLKVPPKEVIQQAQQQSVAGQAKATLEHANQLLNAARTASDAEQKQKYEEARAAYEDGLQKLAQIDSDKPEEQQAIEQTRLSVYQTLASIDYELKQTDRAISRLKQVLDKTPNDPRVLQLMIDFLVQAGREEEAKQYMARLPEGAKLDPNTLLNVGIKAFNEGKMDQAMAEFDRVVKENPNLADAYYYRALVYLNQDKKAEAKADLQKLLQMDPNSKYAKDAKEFLKDLK